MRILITAGPTREYVDDVRFLSNASSGLMGYSIAASAIERGHEVVLVTGPVDLPVPAGAEVHHIEAAVVMSGVVSWVRWCHRNSRGLRLQAT